MAALQDILKALNEQLAQRDSGAFWTGMRQQLTVWSTLRMGEKVFPGADSPEDPRACAVRLSGTGFEYRTDKQRAFGRSGKKSVSVGYHPGIISVEVRVWRPQQFIALASYLPLIHPKVQADKRTAWAVEHPFLSMYGIANVFVNKCSLPEPGDHRMLCVLRMELEEIFDIRDDSPKVLKQAGTGEPKDSNTPTGEEYDVEGPVDYVEEP